MYSLSIYNPNKKIYQLKKLDKYIKFPIPLNNQEKANLITRYKNLTSRQTKAKEFLKIKYGFSEEIIQTANKIYNRTLSAAY